MARPGAKVALALLALATLGGCVQIMPAESGPAASLGALLDAAIAMNQPYPPLPGETVPPLPPVDARY